MPKPIWSLQAALQTRHTWLSFRSQKCAKEWERSEWLPKQAPRNYSCLGAKETSMDRTFAVRSSQHKGASTFTILQALEDSTLDLYQMVWAESWWEGKISLYMYNKAGSAFLLTTWQTRAPNEETILERKSRRWRHLPWSPLCFLLFGGILSILGCWENCSHRSGLGKSPLEQNCTPGRKKQASCGQASLMCPLTQGSLKHNIRTYLVGARLFCWWKRKQTPS